MPASELIRPLGCIEKFLDCCTVQRNLNMAAGVTIKTTSKITLDILERTLTNFQAEHLQLQACLKRNLEIPEKGWSINPFSWFKTPTPIPKPEFWTLPPELNKIQIQFITSKNCDWVTVLEDALQINFEEGKLLWRAYWVDNATDSENRGTLVLNVHPSITDNVGLFIFINDVLYHMDRILTGNLARTAKPKMHTNIEETIGVENGMAFTEKLEIYKNMIICSIPRKRPYTETNTVPLVPDHSTRLVQIEVPLELSRKILKSVVNKGVSLHSLWTAAAGIAMYEMLHLTDKTKFSTTHEANLRLFAKTYNLKEYGAYCNYAEDTMEISKVKSYDEFWYYATVVNQRITEKLQSDLLIKTMVYCGQFGNMYGMFSTLGSNRCVNNDYAIAVNDNIDLLIDDKDTIEIENFCSSVAAHNMGTAFHHSVHVFRGKIFYYMYHYSNYAHIDMVNEFGHKTLEVLSTYCE